MGMRKIEAIIRPEKMADVISALRGLGCPGMTLTEVKGHGKQQGLKQQWRGREYKIDFLPKIKIEIVIEEDSQMLEKILQAIAESARTGEAGDGKVFIWPIEDVMRIRTQERGGEAI